MKNEDKDAATVRLLEFYQPRLCLIFCNTKKKVDELTSLLKENDFQAEGLHGDLTQYQRDIAMGRFRSATTNILIATDVAARGIDVDDVEVVINYDVPQDIEYYVHRIGRTGRAGKSGQSFTLVSGREIFKIREIERICHTTIEEMQIPNTRKVMRSKAFKTLDRVIVYKDHEDLAVMKKFVEKKMVEYECDALDIAAAFLKEAIRDLGQDIAVDDFEIRKPVKDKKDRQFGGRRGGQEFGRGRFGDKRMSREQTKERREGAARRGDTPRRSKAESKSEGGKFFGRRKERKSN